MKQPCTMIVLPKKWHGIFVQKTGTNTDYNGKSGLRVLSILRQILAATGLASNVGM